MERAGRSLLERVRVVAAGHIAEIARELRSAQAVYTDGRLIHSAGGAGVQATIVIAFGDPPPDAAPEGEPAGTHAPPRAHDRAGHPRRLHADMGEAILATGSVSGELLGEPSAELRDRLANTCRNSARVIRPAPTR
jgi:hypothetical protein